VNSSKRSTPLTLSTPRLELIAATLELVRAEVSNLATFAALLDVPTPSSWPPPLNDENSQRYTLNSLEQASPADAGWSVWYCIRRKPRTLLGIVAYKGSPIDGCAEIGYSILDEFQRQGFCTEAARALIRWGFQNLAVDRIVAATLPGLVPSIRIMEKCGMQFAGKGMEDGMETIRYELTREQFIERYDGV